MSIPHQDINSTPTSFSYSSRRNSLTSISTTNTTLTNSGNTSSNSVRDLSTDNLLGLDNKFRKKQIKRVPNGIKSPASSVSQQQQQQKLPKKLVIPQPPPQTPPAQSPDSNTTYYFPNGEIFRPRTGPIKRNRPQKISHHHNQGPPPQQQQHHHSHNHYQQYPPQSHHPSHHQHHYQVPPSQQQQQYYHPPPQHYNPHHSHYPSQPQYNYNPQQQLQPALSVPSSRTNSITSSAPPVFHHLPPHLQNQVQHLQQQQPPSIPNNESPNSMPSSSNSSLTAESIQKINSLTSLNNSSSTTITSTSTNNGSPSAATSYNYPKKLQNPLVKNNNLRSPQSMPITGASVVPGSVTGINDMATFNKYNRSSSITSISSIQRQQLIQQQPPITIHSPQHTSQSYPNLSQFQPYHSYTNLSSNPQQAHSSSSSSSSSPSQRLLLQSNNLLRTSSPQFSTNSSSNPSSTSNSIKNNSSVENIESQQKSSSLAVDPVNGTGSKEVLLKSEANYSTSSHSYTSSTSSSNSMNNNNVSGASEVHIVNNNNNHNSLHRRSSTNTPTTSISNDEKDAFDHDDHEDNEVEVGKEIDTNDGLLSTPAPPEFVRDDDKEYSKSPSVELSPPALLVESPEDQQEEEEEQVPEVQVVNQEDIKTEEVDENVAKEVIKPPLLNSVSSSEDDEEDNEDLFKTPRNSILFSNDSNKLNNNASRSIENLEDNRWDDPQGSSNLTNETLKDEENDKIQSDHQPSTIEIAPPNTVESSLPDPDIENSPPFDIIDDYTVLDEEEDQEEVESIEPNKLNETMEQHEVLEDHLNLASPVHINTAENTFENVEDEPPIERSSLTSEEDTTSSDAYSFDGPENLLLRTVDSPNNIISAPKEAIEEMPSPSKSITVEQKQDKIVTEPIVISERKESLPQSQPVQPEPIVKKKSMLDVLDTVTTTPATAQRVPIPPPKATSSSPQKSLKSRTKSLPDLQPETSSTSSYKSQSNSNLKSLWKKILVPPKLPNKGEMLKNSYSKNSSEISLSSNTSASASLSTATTKFKKSFSVANLKKVNPMKGINTHRAKTEAITSPLPSPPPVPEKPTPVYDLTLPSIEQDTNDLFDDVMLTFDEKLDGVQDSIITENGLETLVKPVFPSGGLRPSKSSNDSVKNEPFLKDDELTSAQIKDAQIKDITGNNKRASGVGSSNRDSTVDDLYIDDNIRFLQSEFNWSNIDDTVNEENSDSAGNDEEDDHKGATSDEENVSMPDNHESNKETIVINNEQLYTIFHNLTDFQKRNLPPHLKYIKQFKDFKFVEINLSKFEDISSIHANNPNHDNDNMNHQSSPILKRRNNLPQFNVEDTTSNKKKVLFSHKIEINETYAADCYKRYNKAVTQYTLTEHSEISKIKNELNYYKCNEMLVHEKSQNNTHFFYL